MKPNRHALTKRLRALAMPIAVKAADRIEALEQTIKQLGAISDICTWHDLGEVCEYCRCPDKAKRQMQADKRKAQ